jgi:predicted transcriptional regulator
MSETVNNQYLIIFQDQRAYTIKINAINKMIEATKGTVRNFFGAWRSNVTQMKIAEGMDT